MSKMTAKQFNARYGVGHSFMYQGSRFLRGGPIVRTLGHAEDKGRGVVIIEINTHPYYVDIDTLITELI
ncbi:hypothetical protein ACF1CY_000761 [Providencia rettgeri]